MDLRQMRYFLAVAEELNFARAADRLHMAQPPLSRQIKAIEDDLGVPLFVRTSRGVELTGAGEALLLEVPNLLALSRRAEDRARRAGQGLVGRLEVGIFGSGILNAIPVMLARFHEARPEVQIVLHSMTKSEQVQALRERKISIGFNRVVPEQADLLVEEVLREPIMVALYEGHPLCSKRYITLKDLDDVPMILYPSAPLPSLAGEVINAFRNAGLRLRIEQPVEEVLTAIALVAGRFGLCITTESATNLRLPGVVYRPLKSRHLQNIELSCLSRRGDNSPILQAFMTVVRGFAQERQVPRDREEKARSP